MNNNSPNLALRAPNLFRDLRALVPNRRLSYRESLTVAELQANVLRERLGITEPNLPSWAITDLPRIRVQRRPGLPVSGLTHWHNGRWLIAVNSDEPKVRQRFSMAHEAKHALDHTIKDRTCWDDAWQTGDTKAERTADYFAGCLLMPKRHIKRLHGERKTPRELAEIFDVSVVAVQVRQSQLGLLPPRPRCLRPGVTSNHFGATYFRTSNRHAEPAEAPA